MRNIPASNNRFKLIATGVILLVVVLGPGIRGCYRTESVAVRYAQLIDPAGINHRVDCALFDSDDNGYRSCTVAWDSRGTTRSRSIECPGGWGLIDCLGANFGTVCKIQRGIVSTDLQ